MSEEGEENGGVRTKPEDAEDGHSADHERRASGEWVIQGKVQENPSETTQLKFEKWAECDIHGNKNDESDDRQSKREEVSYEEELLKNVDPDGERENDDIGEHESSCVQERYLR